MQLQNCFCSVYIENRWEVSYGRVKRDTDATVRGTDATTTMEYLITRHIRKNFSFNVLVCFQLSFLFNHEGRFVQFNFDITSAGDLSGNPSYNFDNN